MHSLFSFRFGYLREELRHLNKLERYDGFLTSIGTNLLISKNYCELEGIIEAPKNSLYKNGIFNFLIKFNDDFPRSRPQIFMKTKIFHTEVNDYDGRCCIKFIREWNEKTSLFLILIGIYEFFFCNNDDGYGGIATDIYKSKNYNLFEEKCQEYIKLYSFNMNEEKIEYFIQDCYDNINEDSIYYFINAQTRGKYKFEVECVEDIIKILIEHFENFIDKVLIADNKIYFSLSEIKEIEELPENHTIFIALKLIQAK
jgi:ubiquitin-protein ligase